MTESGGVRSHAKSLAGVANGGAQLGEDAAVDGLLVIWTIGGREDIEVAAGADDDAGIGRAEWSAGHEGDPVCRTLRVTER